MLRPDKLKALLEEKLNALYVNVSQEVQVVDQTNGLPIGSRIGNPGSMDHPRWDN